MDYNIISHDMSTLIQQHCDHSNLIVTASYYRINAAKNKSELIMFVTSGLY